MADTNDVEKRWNDPETFRSARRYVIAVIAVAAVVFVVYLTGDRYNVPLAVATPLVFFVGAVGAFVQTLRLWRARKVWPIWQGAGWFLLALALLGLSVPGMGLSG